MRPRPYQLEAVDAVDAYLSAGPGNPCVSIATGGGKSPVAAFLLKRYHEPFPAMRSIVLAHVRELIEQNADKMVKVWPEAPVGVYSAGLRCRHMDSPITFAGIQSVWNKADDFDPFDLIIVDEAHRIPLRGEGMYRKFLQACRARNPRVRLVGMTATPYRLGGGSICHPNHLLTEICYEANVKDLIEDGYLCRPQSKATDTTADVSNVHIRQGEFVASELAGAVDTAELVKGAVGEAVARTVTRKSCLWFCVGKDHATHVQEQLASHGRNGVLISDDTPRADRERAISEFKSGRLRDLLNINVLTEGFDAPCCDTVIMLRPTASLALYYQMAGRLLRLLPGTIDNIESKDERLARIAESAKPSGLILDFAGNVVRHGPIDRLSGGKVRTATCPQCREIYSEQCDACPACGWYPTVECPACKEQQRTTLAVCPCGELLMFKLCKAENCGEKNPMPATECVACGTPFGGEVERTIKHGRKAHDAAILSDGKPFSFDVKRVTVKAHQKAGSRPVLWVKYYGEFESVSEFVCLEHDGFAGNKAKNWWRRRFGDPVPATVAEATHDLFLAHNIAGITTSVSVKHGVKYLELISTVLTVGQSAAVAH